MKTSDSSNCYVIKIVTISLFMNHRPLTLMQVTSRFTETGLQKHLGHQGLNAVITSRLTDSFWSKNPWVFSVNHMMRCLDVTVSCGWTRLLLTCNWTVEFVGRYSQRFPLKWTLILFPILAILVKLRYISWTPGGTALFLPIQIEARGPQSGRSLIFWEMQKENINGELHLYSRTDRKCNTLCSLVT